MKDLASVPFKYNNKNIINDIFILYDRIFDKTDYQNRCNKFKKIL